jgi:hypothetical protein
MGLLDIIPISYNQIIMYSAAIYTLGMAVKQKQVQEFAGYALVAGVVWWGIEELQGVLGVDFL